jgi:hypothetical protein
MNQLLILIGGAIMAAGILVNPKKELDEGAKIVPTVSHGDLPPNEPAPIVGDVDELDKPE